jgi:hypothetical protein
VRHVVNASASWEVPVGRGRRFLNSPPALLEGFVGGWRIAGIYRFQSGLPLSFTSTTQSLSAGQRSRGVLIQPLEAKTTMIDGTPYLFADPVAAYQSFRDPRAGEEGSRNVVRLPPYSTIDLALSKLFSMPYSHTHRLEVRWEIFNLLNTQAFGVVDSQVLDRDPYNSAPPASFGRFIGTQTPVGETRAARMMQFALRYSF